MSEFGKKLKNELYKLEFTQSQLAERLGISQGAVANWINGNRQPKIDTVKEISKILGVDLLVDFDGPSVDFKADFPEKLKSVMFNKRINQVELAEKLNISTSTVNHYLTGRRMPRLPDIERMGNILGADLFHDVKEKAQDDSVVSFELLNLNDAKESDLVNFKNLNEVFTVDRDWFKSVFHKEPTSSMKIIFAGCESMSPTFKAGDFLLVDTSETCLKDGVFVFRSNDRLFIKRLQVLPDSVVAISDNSKYLPFDLTPDNTTIIARVIDLWKHELP